jgi:addiction module RelE/StbE family toxin
MWTIYEKKSLIKSVKGYHDEALKGKWKGFRSSRLSLQWRVIYKADLKQLEVYVIDVNAHKY